MQEQLENKMKSNRWGDLSHPECFLKQLFEQQHFGAYQQQPLDYIYRYHIMT
jgi:hypothetical protein